MRVVVTRRRSLLHLLLLTVPFGSPNDCAFPVDLGGQVIERIGRAAADVLLLEPGLPPEGKLVLGGGVVAETVSGAVRLLQRLHQQNIKLISQLNDNRINSEKGGKGGEAAFSKLNLPERCKQNCKIVFRSIQQVTKRMEHRESDNPSYSPFDYNEPVLPSETKKEGAQAASIVFIDEPNLKVFCKECRKEINKVISILSSGVYFCVVCFAKTEQSEEPYQVIKSLNFALVDSSWKAIHEVLFLNCLEKYGIGNWREIKDQMDFYGAKHREAELEEHYYNCYLASEDCLPKFLNNARFFQKRCQQLSSPKPNPPSKASQSTAHASEQYEEVDCFYAKQRNLARKETQLLDCYNFRRNEFEVEYDQDAELLLASLEFRDDDSEEEVRIKYKLMQEYNRRLDRRNHVKEFVLEHRLLEDNYQKEMDKHRTDLQREAFDELRPIARFTTLPEYNHLVRKVAFTKQLKSTIQGLRKFRRSHPSNFKSLDDFLNSQPEESRPKKKGHNENTCHSGKKLEEMLERELKVPKKDFQQLLEDLAANGKRAVYRNVEAVLLESNCDA